MKIKPGLLVTASLFLLLTAGCKKDKSHQQTGEPKLSQLVYEFGTMNLSYAGNGNIHKAVTKNSNREVETVQFNYDDNKIKTVIKNDLIYQYYYTGQQLEHIDILSSTGNTIGRYAFMYQNNILSERVVYAKEAATGQFIPHTKLVYTFSTSGNMEKTQAYFFLINSWAAGEVVVYEYDDKKNTSAHIEWQPFLAKNALMANNPVRVTHRSFFGDLLKTIEYSYTYNSSGQPVTRKTKITTVGNQPTVSTTNYGYSE